MGLSNWKNNSYYYKNLCRYSRVFFLSMILAICCTLITYPGIFYSDSYTRIHISTEIMYGDKDIHSWLTPVPSYFMAVCTFLTGNIAFYTFLQAFVFFSITFLYVIRLSSNYRRLQIILAIISPMIWGVTTYYEAGVGCVTGIAALILLISSLSTEKSRADRIIEFMLICFFSFVTFGYRANAFTILPVVIAALLFGKYKRNIKILGICAIIAGYILVSISAAVLRIDTMSSKSAGFVWETLTAINELEPEDKEMYKDWFDEIAGPGATEQALEMNIKSSVNGFVWDSKLNTDSLSKPDAFSVTMKQYLSFIKEEPKAYIKVKTDFISRTLGISAPINFCEYDYNRNDIMDIYHFSDSFNRRMYLNTYTTFMEAMGFFVLRPYIVFLLTAVLVMYSFKKKDKDRYLFLLVLMVAVFYYGAFVINTQSFEIRYFYPSLYLMAVMDTALIADFVHSLSERSSKHRERIAEKTVSEKKK